MNERIARHTVGIAALRNQAIGTGILISDGPDRYILTAAHVIEGAEPKGVNFWFRPPAPIIEKPAMEATSREVGALTAGISAPIPNVAIDRQADLALLSVDPSFQLPDGSEWYPISRSREFAPWRTDLDGLSVFLFGFPTDNVRPVAVVGNNIFHFLGCGSSVTHYSNQLNLSVWNKLPIKFNAKKDFVIEYNGLGQGIGPHGFSGGGVWVTAVDHRALVWNPDPVLIGVTHNHFPKLGVLAATKLPRVIQFLISSSSDQPEEETKPSSPTVGSQDSAD